MSDRKNRISIALILVLACLIFASGAHPQRGSVLIHNGFLKADVYVGWDANTQRAYAMGLLDGMYQAPAFGAPENNRLLHRIEECVEGKKASQVAAIIELYAKEHPEEWNWDLKDVGYNAILHACPEK